LLWGKLAASPTNAQYLGLQKIPGGGILIIPLEKL
jgi:hypothetical protein